jgi:hypothetical protein
MKGAAKLKYTRGVCGSCVELVGESQLDATRRVQDQLGAPAKAVAALTHVIMPSILTMDLEARLFCCSSSVLELDGIATVHLTALKLYSGPTKPERF